MLVELDSRYIMRMMWTQFVLLFVDWPTFTAVIIKVISLKYPSLWCNITLNWCVCSRLSVSLHKSLCSSSRGKFDHNFLKNPQNVVAFQCTPPSLNLHVCPSHCHVIRQQLLLILHTAVLIFKYSCYLCSCENPFLHNEIVESIF